jgi:hypothetical protein
MDELIQDGDSLVSACYKGSGYKVPTYDDGFGPLWISRNSIRICGIVRAQTWEDAYGICEDEFFPEADETVDQLIKEYRVPPRTRQDHSSRSPQAIPCSIRKRTC